MTIRAIILPCARTRPVSVLPRGRAAPYSEIRASLLASVGADTGMRERPSVPPARGSSRATSLL
jgi:hypothetical protein